MRESNWYCIDVCVKCSKRLSKTQIMHSGGVCPECGYSSSRNIVDTSKVVLKEYAYHPWWRFWNKVFVYKGKDEFSENWANPGKKSNFRKIIFNLTKHLTNINYNNGDIGDLGNEIGFFMYDYFKDKETQNDFLNGFRHGISLKDGTHGREEN